MRTKVFISYHHANDQWAKDHLVYLNNQFNIFDDCSVNSGDIDDTFLTDEQIRVRVRDSYLRDTTVTIVLVGLETRFRKHVDWELYSSMRDSPRYAKSGIVLVPLPETGIEYVVAPHGREEKDHIHSDISEWVALNRTQFEARYPYFSNRMIDNLSAPNSFISVIPWRKIYLSPDNISLAISLAHRDRDRCEYDFSTDMRRRNGRGLRR